MRPPAKRVPTLSRSGVIQRVSLPRRVAADLISIAAMRPSAVSRSQRYLLQMPDLAAADIDDVVEIIGPLLDQLFDPDRQAER